MKLQNSTVVGVTDYYSRVVLMLDDSNIGDTTINLHSCACVHFPAPISTEKSTAQYSTDANIEPLSAKQKLRVSVTVTMVSDMFLRT